MGESVVTSRATRALREIARGWACRMACMPIDTHAHASEDKHVGVGMTSMLHADMHAARAHVRARHYICHAHAQHAEMD